MKTNKRFFVAVTIVVAVLMTAATMVLTRENSTAKYIQTATSDNEYNAELVMRHLRYDGQTLNSGATLNYYDKTGKLRIKDVPLDSIAKGNKCIAVFSSNNCMSCLQTEIATLKKLPCRNEIIYIHDNAKEFISKKKVTGIGMYEMSKGRLCDKIEDSPEHPILLYTDGLRIVTSCVTDPMTTAYTRKFHDFTNKKLSN